MALGQTLHKINKSFMNDESRFQKIQIKDIPIMIGIHDEIICIPRGEEVFAAAICGSSGTGKTLLANRFISGIYHQWESNISIMNDVSEETYKWSEPMTNKNFNLLNEKWLNQLPTASPLVYVFPNTNTISLPKDFGKNFIKTTLPFRDIVENIGFYLKGVSPDFSLGKSELYVNNIKEELASCDSVSSVKEVLNDLLPGQEGKSFQAMRVKIMTAFGALMKEEILDITNPECPSYLQTEGAFLGNPLSVLMKAGWIPSFVTSDLVTKKYKSEVFAYYVHELFQNNLRDFPGEKTFLFFDELKDVCTKDDEPAAQAIGRVAARGRINNIGLIYCTQFYDKIPHGVRGAKLNYCFSFAHSNNDIVRQIGSDFDLDSDDKKKIKNLEKFEVLAMTNNKFAVYRDGERYEETRPIRGTIFPPLANHLKRGNNG